MKPIISFFSLLLQVWTGEMGKKDVKNAKRINKTKTVTDGIYKNFGFQMSIFF